MFQTVLYIYLIMGVIYTMFVVLPDQYVYIKKNATPRWLKRDFVFAYITITLVSLITSPFFPMMLYAKIKGAKKHV